MWVSWFRIADTYPKLLSKYVTENNRAHTRKWWKGQKRDAGWL